LLLMPAFTALLQVVYHLHDAGCDPDDGGYRPNDH
jgi:hypothetical protein